MASLNGIQVLVLVPNEGLEAYLCAVLGRMGLGVVECFPGSEDCVAVIVDEDFLQQSSIPWGGNCLPDIPVIVIGTNGDDPSQWSWADGVLYKLGSAANPKKVMEAVRSSITHG